MHAIQRANDGARARPARIVSICVLGRPATRETQNGARFELLAATIHRIAKRSDWSLIDAVLFPAGYFRLDSAQGPLPWIYRSEEVAETEIAETCTRAAYRLRWHSPGCLIVVGVDTRKSRRAWRGDQLVAAFRSNGLVGGARKIFPVDADTNGWERKPYLLFDEDADHAGRYVRLANGETAVLSACYDGFVFTELALGPTAKRSAMRYIAAGRSWRFLERREADRLLARFDRRLGQMEPAVTLAAIHEFSRPGAELYWQRHGIATASAALGGALSVGAGHFIEKLPGVGQSPLAAFQVPRRHLRASHNRKAEPHQPMDEFVVILPSPYRLRAVVRLFQAA